MIEQTGDIWAQYDQGAWMIITTNGDVKKGGECVMGRGIALQVKERFPDFPRVLGGYLTTHGNNLGVFPLHRIITFPVKTHWHDRAELPIILRSVQQLDVLLSTLNALQFLTHEDMPLAWDPPVSVRPGCGNGHLTWGEVKPIIEPVYSRLGITIVERAP